MRNLTPWLFPAALAGLWLLPKLVYALGMAATVVTGRLERRLTWPYLPMDAAEAPGGRPLPPIDDPATWPTPEAVARLDAFAAEARAAGFRPLGSFREAQSPSLQKVRYDFWLSGDRLVLVVTGAGKVLGMSQAATRLITRLADGRRLITLDAQVASAFDPSGEAPEVLVEGATFEGLLRRHLRRIREAPAAPLPYPADPLDDHRATLARRVDDLEERGYVAYLDPARESWRFTLRGAYVFHRTMHAIGMRRAVEPD